MSPLTADGGLAIEGPRVKEFAPINRKIGWLDMFSHLTFGFTVPPNPCGYRDPYLNTDLYIESGPIGPFTTYLTIKGELLLDNLCVAHFNYLPIPTHDVPFSTFSGIDDTYMDIEMTCGGVPCTTLADVELPEITSYRDRIIDCDVIETLVCKSICQFCIEVQPTDLSSLGWIDSAVTPPTALASEEAWFLDLFTCTNFGGATGTWYQVLTSPSVQPPLPNYFITPIDPNVPQQCPPTATALVPCLFGLGAAYTSITQFPIGSTFSWSVVIDDFGPIVCTLGPYVGKTDDLFMLSGPIPGPIP